MRHLNWNRRRYAAAQCRRALTLCGLGALLWIGAGTAAAQEYTVSTVAGGAPPNTPAAAAGISIGSPQRVTLDKAGDLYFTSLNSVFRIDTNGILTRIAGNS